MSDSTTPNEREAYRQAAMAWRIARDGFPREGKEWKAANENAEKFEARFNHARRINMNEHDSFMLRRIADRLDAAHVG